MFCGHWDKRKWAGAYFPAERRIRERPQRSGKTPPAGKSENNRNRHGEKANSPIDGDLGLVLFFAKK